MRERLRLALASLEPAKEETRPRAVGGGQPPESA
jgi:hypothetical protein